jgi:hypothetical protein
VEIIFQYIQIFESMSKKKYFNRVKSKSGNKKSLHQRGIIFIYRFLRYV